jgi:hypothetical protein
VVAPQHWPHVHSTDYNTALHRKQLQPTIRNSSVTVLLKCIGTCGGSVLSSESHASVIFAVSLAMMSSFCKSLRARPCLIILSQNFSSCSILGIGDTDLSPAATCCNVLACIQCSANVCKQGVSAHSIWRVLHHSSGSEQLH